MVDQIGIAAATVIQSGAVGPDQNTGQGFAEELAKQTNEKNQGSCCGGDQKDQNTALAIPTVE